MDQIIFWQRIVSPSTFGLAQALQWRGHKVTYVVEELISERREKMGWSGVETGPIETIIFRDNDHIEKLIKDFPDNTVHLVQGVYANGIMEEVRRILKIHRPRWGVVMETIDERFWYWPLRRFVYWTRLSKWASRPDFILAIGVDTPNWVTSRGAAVDRTFPFTYFIPAPAKEIPYTTHQHRPFRIGFVGSLISRKRADLLIDALKELTHHNFELIIVGNGPLRNHIRQKAVASIGREKLTFYDMIPIAEISSTIMAKLDCFVLPSDHDGWGVVVTEALMVGTPAICSNACGSAEAVSASGVGGIFPKGDVQALHSLLDSFISKGPLNFTERQRLARWAKCFSPEFGAQYVSDILSFVYGDGEKPMPPWSEKLAKNQFSDH